MRLTIGFSPCPNDTFMMDALVHGRIDNGNILWDKRIDDIETLNRRALQGFLDVTKMSISAWLRMQDSYTLLHSGAALGFGCGPLIVSMTQLSEEELSQGPIAIPGELTTANLLFSLKYPQIRNKIPMLFSKIEEAVLKGEVLAGVIIHESRFTYHKKSLVKVLDLGEDWERSTGLPIPLGIFAAKSSLGPEMQQEISAQIQNSVKYAFNHPSDVMPFVRDLAQEMDDDVMEAHIRTYVNDFSINLGSQGLEAIQLLQKRASEANFF